MKRWSLILLVGYFLFLFMLAFVFDFPSEVTRQWIWIQVGGIVFMVVLGGYLEGSVPRRDLITIGAFTLLWFGLAPVLTIKKEYFTLLGLIIELALVMILRKVG